MTTVIILSGTIAMIIGIDNVLHIVTYDELEQCYLRCAKQRNSKPLQAQVTAITPAVVIIWNMLILIKLKWFIPHLHHLVLAIAK